MRLLLTRILLLLAVALLASAVAIPANSMAKSSGYTFTVPIENMDEGGEYPEDEEEYDEEEIPAEEEEGEEVCPWVDYLATGTEECAAPEFNPGFLKKAWPINVVKTGLKDSTLRVKLISIQAGADFAEDAELLEGVAATASVSKKTKVLAKKGGKLKKASVKQLRKAEKLSIRARVLPTDSWKQDEQGYMVPVLKISRIVIG